MQAFELAVLWMAGVLFGVIIANSVPRRYLLQWPSSGLLLSTLLFAAGALLLSSWQLPLWTMAIILTMTIPDVTTATRCSPATCILTITLAILITLSAGWWFPDHAAQFLGLCLVMSALWQGLSLKRIFLHSTLLMGASQALLLFLGLLAGLVLVITAADHIWLMQLLVAMAMLRIASTLFTTPAAQQGRQPDAVVHQAIARERERIYQNLHDDIGSRLLSLIHRSTTPEDADFARCLLQDLRDAVARTIQHRITLGELLADQKDETTQRIEALDMTLHWPRPQDIPDIPLPPACVTTIKRCLRELTSNIIRHANASSIHLECRIDHQSLELMLRDDGIGFAPDHKEGRGMSSIRNRLQSLQGTVEWHRPAEGGTQVRLQIPLVAGALS